MFISRLKVRVKSQETMSMRLIYKIITGVRYLRLPAPRIIFSPLLYLHLVVRKLLTNLLVFFYWQPLFRQYLDNRPKKLRLDKTLPFIMGEPKILLGNQCCVNGDIIIVGKTMSGTKPVLDIGNNVSIQYQSQFYIGSKIVVGDYCLIAERCVLRGYAGHSLNPEERKRGLEEGPNQRGDIILEENVWLGSGVIINPNVRIGENSVIASGSVVTKDIPKNVLAGGIPAKVIRSL